MRISFERKASGAATLSPDRSTPQPIRKSSVFLGHNSLTLIFDISLQRYSSVAQPDVAMTHLSGYKSHMP